MIATGIAGLRVPCAQPGCAGYYRPLRARTGYKFYSCATCRKTLDRDVHAAWLRVIQDAVRDGADVAYVIAEKAADGAWNVARRGPGPHPQEAMVAAGT